MSDRFQIVVTGGRDLADESLVWRTLDDIHQVTPITLLVEGGCPTGADKFARTWAAARGVDRKTVAADWLTHVCQPGSPCRQSQRCRAAGPVRNGKMLREESPDRVVAFPTGGPGTRDCMAQAVRMGIDVKVVRG
jgi:SLOG family YspA-like protein